MLNDHVLAVTLLLILCLISIALGAAVMRSYLTHKSCPPEKEKVTIEFDRESLRRRLCALRAKQDTYLKYQHIPSLDLLGWLEGLSEIKAEIAIAERLLNEATPNGKEETS